MAQQKPYQKDFQSGKGKKKQEIPEEDLPDSLDSEDTDDSFDEDETDKGLRRWN